MNERIKEARVKAGLSQKEAAISLHVSGPTVSEWESGKKTPSTDKVIKMAKLFNVSTDYLLGRTIEITPHSDIPAYGSFFMWFSAEKKRCLLECLNNACAEKGITPNFAIAQSGVHSDLFHRLSSGNGGVCPPLDILCIAEYLSVQDKVLDIFNAPEIAKDTLDLDSTYAVERIATQIYKKSVELKQIFAGQKVAASTKEDAVLDKSGEDQSTAPSTIDMKLKNASK